MGKLLQLAYIKIRKKKKIRESVNFITFLQSLVGVKGITPTTPRRRNMAESRGFMILLRSFTTVGDVTQVFTAWQPSLKEAKAPPAADG